MTLKAISEGRYVDKNISYHREKMFLDLQISEGCFKKLRGNRENGLRKKPSKLRIKLIFPLQALLK